MKRVANCYNPFTFIPLLYFYFELGCVRGRSYGVVLWEIMTLAAVPYCGSANEQIVENVKSGIRNTLDPVPECPPLL